MVQLVVVVMLVGGSGDDGCCCDGGGAGDIKYNDQNRFELRGITDWPNKVGTLNLKPYKLRILTKLGVLPLVIWLYDD